MTPEQIQVRKDIQNRLTALGYDIGPYGADGVFGADTQRALRLYQADNHLTVTGQPDPDTMSALFPPKPKGLSIVDATLADYLLNFITSKINWFAGVMAGVIVTFINTKFGLQLDTGTTAAITTVLVAILTGGVWLLRTFFAAPKVVTKQPEIVKSP